MTVILSLAAQLLHIGLMLVAAPISAGLLAWLQARLTRRAGPPVLAPWRDLVRLARKTTARPEYVSPVAEFAPAVGLGAVLSAATLVPSFATGMALAPLADVLVIVSLLATARVADVLAALDCGSAVPGLAAQSGSALAVLAEPSLLLAVLALGVMGDSFNLDAIIGQQREGLLPSVSLAVAATGLLALLVADFSASGGNDGLDRMFSGLPLAMSLMAGWLRRLIWFDLVTSLFFPAGMAAAGSLPLLWLAGLALWAIKLAAFILVLAAAETFLGRLPRRRLPTLIGAAALLALLATIVVLAGSGLA